MCKLFTIIVIRSARNRKKFYDDHRDDGGKPVAVSYHTESGTVKVDNNDENKAINSKNGVTSTIINIDVPDSENAANQISLGEHKINAKQNASTATATTATTTDSEQDAADSIGGDAWLRQKQWHRRLQTPVWARCSIKTQIFFLQNILFIPLSLSISLSLYTSDSDAHTIFCHRFNLIFRSNIAKKSNDRIKHTSTTTISTYHQ